MSSKKNPQDHKPKKQKSVTSASAWKSKSGRAGVETDLELPSGNVCRVRRVDMPTLLASGAFPDSLMAMVSDKIDTATGKKDSPKEMDQDEVKSIIADKEKMTALFESIDRLVPIVVVQPRVQNHNLISEDNKVVRPLTEVERQAIEEEFEGDVIFTDDVELEDKMFIFQFVTGGKREVETFRAELESAVGDVSAN